MFTRLPFGIWHFALFPAATQGGNDGCPCKWLLEAQPTRLSLLFVPVDVYLRAARAGVYTESVMQDTERLPSPASPLLLRLEVLNSNLPIPLVII